jgi:ATP-dependent Clp protease ATP-binding subunit ClpA
MDVQAAELYDVKGILKLPFRIIGQLPAISPLQRYILKHVANDADDPEPLIMVFAGPPGQGKTELAEHLGGLLSVN